MRGPGLALPQFSMQHAWQHGWHGADVWWDAAPLHSFCQHQRVSSPAPSPACLPRSRHLTAGHAAPTGGRDYACIVFLMSRPARGAVAPAPPVTGAGQQLRVRLHTPSSSRMRPAAGLPMSLCMCAPCPFCASYSCLFNEFSAAEAVRESRRGLHDAGPLLQSSNPCWELRRSPCVHAAQRRPMRRGPCRVQERPP